MERDKVLEKEFYAEWADTIVVLEQLADKGTEPYFWHYEPGKISSLRFSIKCPCGSITCVLKWRGGNKRRIAWYISIKNGFTQNASLENVLSILPSEKKKILILNLDIF